MEERESDVVWAIEITLPSVRGSSPRDLDGNLVTFFQWTES